ncbi:MAG TPA: DoxX family protein [Polyangiaceae bacterium]|nr:DoxX family protein [Polyangiaceae bacterium]
MSFITSPSSLLLRAGTSARRVAFLAPLLARVTVGVAFAESGWGKLHNLDKVAAYFTELGIPAPAFQATFVSWVELICGSLVLLGLATRLAAVPLIATMVVALITAKASDIAGFSDLIGTIEFCYAVLLAWLVLAGAGTASLDHLIARRATALAAERTGLPAALV